jgi:hypothetical protein
VLPAPQACPGLSFIPAGFLLAVKLCKPSPPRWHPRAVPKITRQTNHAKTSHHAKVTAAKTRTVMKANKRASFGLCPPTAMLVSHCVQANVRRFLAAVATSREGRRSSKSGGHPRPACSLPSPLQNRYNDGSLCEFLERRVLCHGSASAAPW